MAKSIADSLDLLDSSLADINIALSDKNVEVPYNLKVSEVASYIDQIPSGISYIPMCDGKTFNSKLKAMNGWDQALSIQFTDYSPDSSMDLIDVSEAGDKSVVAWREGAQVYISAYGSGFAFNADCTNMFHGFSNIARIDFWGVNTSNVTNVYAMFDSCGVYDLDVSSFDTSNVTDFSFMFCACKNLSSIDVSNFDVSSAKNIWGMFKMCTKLVMLDVTSFDLRSATQWAEFVYGCTNLAVIDLSSFVPCDGLYTITRMFEDCINLQIIYASCDWTQYGDFLSMSANAFLNCEKLPGYQPLTQYKGPKKAKFIDDGGYFTPRP